jgi:RNA polymerase sigma factor (sigma-70 family)
VPEGEAAANLIRRFQAGDERAADELFARYARQLARVADQYLNRKVGGRLDGADVVQSALNSFFGRCRKGEFRIDGSDDLWRLLLRITVRKAQARARRHTAARRNAVREAAGGDDLLAEHLTRQPGPDEVALLADQMEALLRGLPPECGRVLEMRLAGHTVPEIMAEAGLTRRVVYHILDELKRRLLRDYPDERA